LAVDSARPGRLNALAVFAFCAEITRLPGHWSPRLAPVKATAQTTPSRLTTVAHISRPNPPFPSAWLCAASSAAFTSACEGSALHALPPPPLPSPVAAVGTPVSQMAAVITAAVDTRTFFIRVLLHVGIAARRGRYHRTPVGAQTHDHDGKFVQPRVLACARD
jgi:hypothetical protein